MATVTLKGNTCNLSGTELNVGDVAPQVTLVNSKGLEDKVVGGASDNTQLIVVVPSLDTEVCASDRAALSSLREGRPGTPFPARAGSRPRRGRREPAPRA